MRGGLALRRLREHRGTGSARPPVSPPAGERRSDTKCPESWARVQKHRGTGFAGPQVLLPGRGKEKRHEVRASWGRVENTAEPALPGRRCCPRVGGRRSDTKCAHPGGESRTPRNRLCRAAGVAPGRGKEKRHEVRASWGRAYYLALRDPSSKTSSSRCSSPLSSQARSRVTRPLASKLDSASSEPFSLKRWCVPIGICRPRPTTW